jgi:hypothetical protein
MTLRRCPGGRCRSRRPGRPPAPVAQVELGQQAAHVGLDGGLADHQVLGDLGVGHAPCHQAEHLQLAGGQAVEGGRAGGGRVGQLGDEAVEQLPGHRGGEQRVPGGDHPDRLDQVLGRDVLEQEPAGPGAQRRQHVLVEVEGGQDQHPDRVLDAVAGQAPGRLDPVHAGHADVHEHDVGPDVPGQPHRLGPIGRLPDHLEARLGVQDHPEPGPHQRLVVGDQDPDGHGAPPSRGRRAATRKPPPGRAPASRVPPNRATRSRMPMRP